MSTDPTPGETHVTHGSGGGLLGGSYGLGFIGAVVYFVQNAHSLGQGVLGVLKAIVWPAILVYALLQHMAK